MSQNWYTFGNASGTFSTDNSSSTTWQTYKITYYDPMEYEAKSVAPDAPIPDPSDKPKVKTTTVDPLDWLNDRVAEITELVEI